MFHPYQCLQLCGEVLVAASASRLDSFDIKTGLLLSSWQSPVSFPTVIGTEVIAAEKSGETEFAISQDSSIDFGRDIDPPPKRRRLSDATDTNATYQSLDRDALNVKKSQALAFIALNATGDGCHVIGATAEDKCIRVFEHDGKGQLKEVNQRIMPKRPCAITITGDGSTIICADKFGDVYSLPLHAPAVSAEAGRDSEDFEKTSLLSGPLKPFMPAANDLTVHSLRNRKALEHQLRQGQNISEKPQRPNKHNLQLGHVSMLTDIALLEYQGRSYIITADRDEHIRISRGIPQAHVIHGYCLGHKNFVSRLCFPTEKLNLLISGGGDDKIYMWNWLEGEIIGTASLRGHVESVMADLVQGQRTDKQEDGDTSSGLVRIAVSNIRCLKGSSSQLNSTIVVTCEGIPALFLFTISAGPVLEFHQTLWLEGNPLSVVVDDENNNLILSIDCIHQPGTTSHLRYDLDAIIQPLIIFHSTGSEWVREPLQFDIGSRTTLAPPEDKSDSLGTLSHMLYSLENLRKHGGEE